MMNYEIFKEVFKEKLLDYMPDEFKEHRVVEHKVFKVNCEKDAINLLSGDVPRIELFARKTADGWDCLGDEIDGKDIRDALKGVIENEC